MAAPTVVREYAIEEPEDYIGRVNLFEVEPWGRADLGFAVCVPREYEAKAKIDPPGVVPPATFQRLCAFESVVPPEESLDVAVCRPLEVNLADLAVRDIRAHRMEPYLIGMLDVGDRTVVETESRYAADGGVHAVRSLYYPNGPRVYRVSLFLEPQDLASRDRDWDAILQTFHALQPSPERFLEPMVTYRGKGQLLLSFVHPERFTAELEPDDEPSRTAVTLTLPGRESEARCRIRVKAMGRESVDMAPEELVTDALSDLRRLFVASFEDHPMESERVPAPGPMFEAQGVYAAYRARSKDGADLELRVIAARTKRVGYSLAAVLPLERDDPLAWMHGKRALEVACLTLLRPNAVRAINLDLERLPAPERTDEEHREDLAALLADASAARRAVKTQEALEARSEAFARKAAAKTRTVATQKGLVGKDARDQRDAEDDLKRPARKRSVSSARAVLDRLKKNKD